MAATVRGDHDLAELTGAPSTSPGPLRRRRLPVAAALVVALVGGTAAGCGGGGRTVIDLGSRGDVAVDTCANNCVFPGACCGSPARCLDVTGDPNHCGRCDNVCSGGTRCVGGVCQCPGANGPCAPGTLCCPKVGCRNPLTDSQNCGACGQACPDGENCTAGRCGCRGATCKPGEICCGGKCVNPNGSDVNNCGACGTVCPKGATCTKGVCSGAPVGDGGACACAKKCLGPCSAGCCLEDVLGGRCTPNPKCLGG